MSSTLPASLEPIIPGFHPDPSICRAGEDYYLVNSSFEYSPGIPVWHSRDLRSWTQIGNAFSAAQDWVPGHAASSGGVYAPTIRHRNGTFWIITTDVASATGQVLTSATHPAGPWSPLRRVEGLPGIDPDLAWDGDDCYLTYCSTAPAMRGIAQARVDIESGTVLEGPYRVWGGTGLAFPEAPHLYLHDGWWYLVIAEGGTERGHAVTVARSQSPRGPFVAAPTNPVFTHRSTSHPVQNAGHADLVETPTGEWAAVYLAVRPRGITPMFHVNGRETFLAGVRWEHEWPVFDEDHFTVPSVGRSFSDDLAGPLHPRWVSPGLAIDDQIGGHDASGTLIRTAAGSSRAMTAVVARVTDAHWTFSAEVDGVDGVAGILLRLDDDHWVEARVSDGSAVAVARIGSLELPLTDAVGLDGGAVRVVVRSVQATTQGPDDIRLAVVQAGVEPPRRSVPLDRGGGRVHRPRRGRPRRRRGLPPALRRVRPDSRLTRLLCGPAAVAGQHRTVDVHTVVGQQEGDRRRDLLGRGD